MSNNKLIGFVTSISLNKSVIVTIFRKYKHSKYLKLKKKIKKLMVHDLNNICKKGNLVLINQTKPISKRKNWIIEKIIINK